MSVKIAYFAHDLTDAAVDRRVRMLVAGGASVKLIGFRRTTDVRKATDRISPIDLGQTFDGRLVRRVLSVLQALSAPNSYAHGLRDANVVLARNLEMLTIATIARKRYAPSATLVYECLDIHRALLSNQVPGVLLRLLESKLWQQVDGMVTSSPGFVRNYFMPRAFPAPIRLVENKVLLEGDNPVSCAAKRPPGPPWRIGWFGAIRCRKSLQILSELASASDGGVEVVIRGRPSQAVFPDFDAAVRNLRYVKYGGAYQNPQDLAGIYGGVHFNWTLDYYESGQNSAWLLPNRLYEGSLYGAIPIGLASVEAGAWLTKHGVGVVLSEPIPERLVNFFQSLDQPSYAKLADAITTLPREAVVNDRVDCRDLVEALSRLPTIEASAQSTDAEGAFADPRSNNLGVQQ